MRTSRRLSLQKKSAFLDALGKGYSVSGAAKAAGATRNTFYKHRREEPEFAAAWDEAYEIGTDRLEDVLQVRALEGNTAELIFALKSRRPERYRDNTRIEHTGPGGGPIEIDVDARESLARRIAELAARLGQGANTGGDKPDAGEKPAA